MGPELVARQIRDRYCELLGIGPPPEKGDYFVALDAYVKTLKRTGPAPRWAINSPARLRSNKSRP